MNSKNIYVPKIFFILVALLAFVFACERQQKNSCKSISNGSSAPEDTHIYGKRKNRDSVVLSLAQQILLAIKDNNYQKIADFIHPNLGVRFSPYGYIDTLNHIKFNPKQFLQQVKKSEEIKWGHYDGTGKEIILPIDQYFEEFVYDADFLHADTTSVNEIIGKGNSLNNLEEVYPGSDFVEKHFYGGDKRYGGMDWRSLRLVFQPLKEELYIVAIVHDQWTI